MFCDKFFYDLFYYRFVYVFSATFDFVNFLKCVSNHTDLKQLLCLFFNCTCVIIADMLISLCP